LNLKKLLKNIKLNEENISMVLGALVIVIVGILVVNYFRDKKSEILPAISTENKAKEHVVVRGETLWSIAEDSFGSGYNWVDVKSENKLTSDKIEVGQKLAIPEVAAKKPTATKQVVIVKAQNPISGDSYTVEKGDTLWNIAVRAYGDGYRWVEIAKNNNLKNPNLIYAGNVLTLTR
jgi:putative chitinase